MNPENSLNISTVYPYIVPSAYLEHGTADSARPLGHGLYSALIFDLGDMVRNVTENDLVVLGLSHDQAFETALKNLEVLIKGRRVQSRLFPMGPGGKPFALFGGHWAAATCLLLPGLHGKLSGPLKAEVLWASIPHRDAMLIFPSGDEGLRQAVNAMVREKESDAAKPLTFQLFELSSRGVVELPE